MPNIETQTTSTLIVYAEWDAEAGVWVAHSTDIPGLNIEAATWDDFSRRVHAAAMDLIELNHVVLDSDGAVIRIVTEERIPVAA